MMGIKAYQEKMFYDLSLSRRVPENHFLRKLEELLDLRFIRELVGSTYSHTGQPSIDPVVLFKMMLIGYFYGITSERRLAEDSSLNLAYLWYLGYDLDETTPDHSVISKARVRYGKEIFEKFFQQVLQQCVQAGLVRGEKVFADSTYIRADASLKSLVPRPDAVAPALSPAEFINQVFTENPVAEPAAAADTVKETPAQKEPPFSNKTHLSQTDPDAALISHGQKLPLQLAYKEHFTVDSAARVITAVTVTPANIGDETQLETLLAQQPGPVQEVGADSKYGTCANYKFLLERNILPSIPVWEPGSPTKLKRFGQKRFAYEVATDTYQCPAGHQLTRNSDTVHNNCCTYHAKKKACKECPLREQCLSPKVAVRHIFRTVNQDYKDRALVHLATVQAQQTIRERKSYAEWINAESKTRHGLRRAKFRGLDKVAIQVLMTATVQNIKRLVTGLTNQTNPVPNFKEQVRQIRDWLPLFARLNFA